MSKLYRLPVVTAAVLTCLSATNVAAGTYKSIANKILIEANAKVSITLFKFEQDADSDPCVGEDKTITFDISPESPATSKWLDSIILSRSSKEVLHFNYDDSCNLVSLSYPDLFSSGSNGEGGALQTTGLNGNVALIGTNGLDADSITASAYHSSDVPAGAFDGYDYFEKINDSAGDKIARGIWLAKVKSADNKAVKPWIQINFANLVDIRGIGLFVNERSTELGRVPRKVVISSSETGEEFTKITEYSMSNREDNIIELPATTRAAYFRIEAQGSYGDPNYIELDEIEFYQP